MMRSCGCREIDMKRAIQTLLALGCLAIASSVLLALRVLLAFLRVLLALGCLTVVAGVLLALLALRVLLLAFLRVEWVSVLRLMTVRCAVASMLFG